MITAKLLLYLALKLKNNIDVVMIHQILYEVVKLKPQDYVDPK